MQVEIVTIQQVIDIFTSFARNVPFGPHISSNTTAPLVNCTVNNALYVPYSAKRPTNVASVQLRRELATGKRAAGRSLQKIFNQFR